LVVRESRVLLRERVSVGAGDQAIEVVRWVGHDLNKPTALLVHGTGFAAEVWEELALPLCATHSVLAIDRRGHGRSYKPAGDSYHFSDFAQDLRAVIEALDLRDIYGIGHSAGATDLLLAAAALPDRFSRMFALEPTAMRPPAVEATAQGRQLFEALRDATLRRKTELVSADAAFARYRSRPAFAKWTESALWSYLRAGFEELPSGSLRLLCTPEIEVAMLGPIGEAMANAYHGDHRGQPFEALLRIEVPVRISTSEHSDAIYKHMASVAAELVPNASTTHFANVGHCAVQEAPELVLGEVMRFARDTSP
jgi:pimeloyl-ACP methyl ester carboxylesterase